MTLVYFCDPDPYNLTNNLIYMKGHLTHFEILTPTWPLRDPYWEGAKSSKILSKNFLTYKDFKTTNNSFSSKWHLSTSSTTDFNCSSSTLEWTTFYYKNCKKYYRL